ncbi:MAG: SDR family NAD(P)-dependent oxidoreductase, partial [Burkholderiales bacterium]
MKLASKIALVTGGAQGIGLACAQRFAREGARVAIVDLDARLGEKAASELATAGLFIQADVARDDSAAKVLQIVSDQLGPVDVLLNNAGITHAADFLDLRIEDFDRVLGINLRSYVLFGQA